MKRWMKPGEMYATYMGLRAASTLRQHAERLPGGHPVRLTLQTLLERWGYDGQPVDFTSAAERERARRLHQLDR